jgi:hypothetical protein
MVQSQKNPRMATILIVGAKQVFALKEQRLKQWFIPTVIDSDR